jgi:hypothetical protein
MTTDQEPALLQYTCERCNKGYVLPPSGLQLSPVGHLRAVWIGLRGMLGRPHGPKDVAESRQQILAESDDEAYQAFVQGMHFCLDCRRFVCDDCWRGPRSVCQDCAGTGVSPVTRTSLIAAPQPVPPPPARAAELTAEVLRPVVRPNPRPSIRWRPGAPKAAAAVALILVVLLGGSAFAAIAMAPGPTPEIIYRTATPTETSTATMAPTETWSATPEVSPSASSSAGPSTSPGASGTPTPRPTAAPTRAPGATPTKAPTPTGAPNPTPTHAPTPTPTPTPTDTPAPTPTPPLTQPTISCISTGYSDAIPYIAECSIDSGANQPGASVTWYLDDSWTGDVGNSASILVDGTTHPSPTIKLEISRDGTTVSATVTGAGGVWS